MKLFLAYRTFLVCIFAFIFSAQAEFSITKPLESIKTIFHALKSNAHQIYLDYPKHAPDVYLAQIKFSCNPKNSELLIGPLKKYFEYHVSLYSLNSESKIKLFRSFFRTIILDKWAILYSSSKWNNFLQRILIRDCFLNEVRHYLSDNTNSLSGHTLSLLSNLLTKLSEVAFSYPGLSQENRLFIEKVTDFVLQNFNNLCTSVAGNEIIYHCIQLNTALKNHVKLTALTKSALRNSTMLSANIIYSIIQADPCNKTIKDILCLAKPPTSFLQNYLLRLAYNTTCKNNSCPLVNIAHPTIQHLNDNANYLFNHYHDVVKCFIGSPGLSLLAERIFSLQQEYNNQGYSTFVHGQRLAYYVPELWFTKLWALFNHPIDNFLFTHIKKFNYSASSILKNKKMRKEIRRNGRYNQKSRDRLLFMNIALFGNISNLGSNTAHYILRNHNINSIPISLKKVFELYGCGSIYKQFKQDIEALEKEQKALSNYGVALVIAVPNSILKKCVFPAKPGGYKKGVFIDGIGITNDIEIIVKQYQKDASLLSNSDKLEFCLIMDTKYGLNPDSGIKITPLVPTSPSLLNAFHEKEAVLWQKIEQAIINQEENL